MSSIVLKSTWAFKPACCDQRIHKLKRGYLVLYTDCKENVSNATQWFGVFRKASGKSLFHQIAFKELYVTKS